MYVRVEHRAPLVPPILQAYGVSVSPLRGLGAAQAVTPAQLSVAQMIVATADQYGVPPELALGIAAHESGFNPSAVNSTGGAAGVMQILPSNWASLGITDPLDAQQNITGGVSMLAQLLQKYNGNQTLALWAYSNGSGSVTAGNSNPANAPAQAADLINYVENVYQPPASLDLSAAAAAPDTSADDSSGFDLSTLDLSSVSASVSSFLGSLDPMTLSIGAAGLALLLFYSLE
jgi:soluble lytic murein transglycosylase-like protein